MAASTYAEKLRQRFGNLLSEPVEFRGEITLGVTEVGRVAEVCGYAKAELGFDFILDISSVDFYGEDPRFAVVYELYSQSHRTHLRLKTRVGEGREVPSVSGVWRGASWHEREVYDMMGIGFAGHPDLRRLIMWEGYPYYPLRKDFPLAGKPTDLPEVAFSETAPIEGGPFVTTPGGRDATEREPRAKDL